MTTEFNLTTEPWLPVTDRTGGHATCSLTDLFRHAHELRDLAAETPLTQAALYRLLLAVLHHAYQGPTDGRAWSRLWRQGRFDQTIPDYLAQRRERFDLFSATHPFHQTPGLETESTPAPVSKLFHELACANNKTLFDHTLDASPPRLTPAAAARALVTFQNYALGGGKSASSNRFGPHPYFGHAPLIQGAVVFIEGDDLFQTLLLNAVYYDPTEPNVPIPRDFEEPDLPVWERSALRRPPGEYPAAGYLEYLTWTSRHLRLIPEGDGHDTFVSRFYMAQGEGLTGEVVDPFMARKETKLGTFPIKLQEERALWRDSGSLFAFKSGPGSHELAPGNLRQARDMADVIDRPVLGCIVIGLANNKANPLLWRMESLPIRRPFLLDDELPAYLKKALHWSDEIGSALREEVKWLAGEILTNGNRRPDDKDASKFAANLGSESLYWAAMEPLFRLYLAELPDAPDRQQRQRQWQEDTVKTADGILDETTKNALGYNARELKARVLARESFRRTTFGKLKRNHLTEAAGP